mmetsp:Transcript_4965/g.10957  ORF Transcript_4965/g.10957 Transcript_4965/m.10957 type:complete len:362 (-) Transcript_4965:324-1409(-)
MARASCTSTIAFSVSAGASYTTSSLAALSAAHRARCIVSAITSPTGAPQKGTLSPTPNIIGVSAPKTGLHTGLLKSGRKTVSTCHSAGMGLISLMVELGMAWAVIRAAWSMPSRPCWPSFIAISSQNMAVPPHCSSTRSFSSPAVPNGARSSQGSMVILLVCSLVSLWMASGTGCPVVATPAATARRPMNLATKEEASSRRDSPNSMSLKSAVMASSIAADNGNPTKSFTSFPVRAASTAGSRRTIATFSAPRVKRTDFTLAPSRTPHTAPFIRHLALRGRKATRWESKTPAGISNSTETKNSPAAGDSVNHLLIGVDFSVLTVASKASNIGQTSEGNRPSSPLPTRVAHTLPPTVARLRT